MAKLLNQDDYNALDAEIQSGKRNGRLIKNVTSWRDTMSMRTVVLLTYERDPDAPLVGEPPMQERLEFAPDVNLGPQ